MSFAYACATSDAGHPEVALQNIESTNERWGGNGPSW